MTIPLAIVQGVSLLLMLKSQGVIVDLSIFNMITNLSVIVAGSVLIMWIGELISEFGIGNGTSLIIFAGIVAAVPTHLAQLLVTFSPDQIPLYVAFVVVALVVVVMLFVTMY